VYETSALATLFCSIRTLNQTDKNFSRNGQEEGHSKLAKNAKRTVSQKLFWFKTKALLTFLWAAFSAWNEVPTTFIVTFLARPRKVTERRVPGGTS
jgi:hypothetical protein